MKTDTVLARFEVGQKASLSKTIRAEDIETFAALTGDTNPVHLDDEYARQTRFGRRIAHGMLVSGVISAAIGTLLPGPGTIYLHQEVDFRGPVYIGDTVTATIEILHTRGDKPILTLGTKCHNQNNQLIIEGKAVVLFQPVAET